VSAAEAERRVRVTLIRLLAEWPDLRDLFDLEQMRAGLLRALAEADAGDDLEAMWARPAKAPP
jgi:hypothetical protein